VATTETANAASEKQWYEYIWRKLTELSEKFQAKTNENGDFRWKAGSGEEKLLFTASRVNRHVCAEFPLPRRT